MDRFKVGVCVLARIKKNFKKEKRRKRRALQKRGFTHFISMAY